MDEINKIYFISVKLYSIDRYVLEIVLLLSIISIYEYVRSSFSVLYID